MSSLTGITLTPATVAPGGSFVVTLTISNPDKVHTIKGTDETGTAVTATLSVHENLTVTTDVTKKGQLGVIVVESDSGDALTPSPTDITKVAGVAHA